MHKRLIISAVILFASFWIYGFATSLYAGRCRTADIAAADRAEICRNARWLNGWLMTDAQLGGMFLHEGIALAEAGREAEARAAFVESIRLRVGANADSLMAEDIRQLAQGDPRAEMLWNEAVREMAGE
jgi:hypothetical protein